MPFSSLAMRSPTTPSSLRNQIPVRKITAAAKAMDELINHLNVAHRRAQRSRVLHATLHQFNLIDP